MRVSWLALTSGCLIVLALACGKQSAFAASNAGYSAFICAGQSNAAGRGAYDPANDTSDPRVFQWDAVPSDPHYQTIIKGDDPLYMPEGIEKGQVGPCHAVAEAYRATLPPGRRVLIIPLAAGNTGLTLHSFHPFWYPTVSTQHSTPGYLYSNAITEANRAIAAAKAEFPDSQLDFIIWSQGENDNQQPDYAETFDELLKGWRAGITGAAGVPFIVSSMNPYAIAHLYDGGIDLIQKDTPRRALRTAFAQRGDNLVSGAPVGAELYCAPGSACAAAGVAHFSGPAQHLQALSIFHALAYADANVLGRTPAEPKHLTAAVVLATAVHLQWTSPLSRMTGAIVQYQVSNANGWTTFPTPPGQYNDLAPLSDVNVTGLAPSTTYRFRVADLNESGTGPYSDIISATTSTAVMPIRNPVVAAVTRNPTADGATVAWLPPYSDDTPTSFSIRYRPAGAGGPQTTVSAKSSPYVITGASRGTAYEVVIAPVDSAGTGPYSHAVSFTTIAAP